MSNKEIDYPFTAFPNYIIDEKLRDIDGSTFKVLTVIVRKTCGFRKKYDRISLSQLESHANLSKTTIIKALKLLCDEQIIKKDSSGRINRYCVVKVKGENQAEYLKSTTNTSDSTNYEQDGSKNEQSKVHKLNPSPVQNLNTQKKPIKENETKSSTTKERDVERVINAWNSKFEIPVNTKNLSLVEHVHSAVNDFGVEQLIQAMEGRLESPYYREKQPDLLHHPMAFFPYPDTIRNDLQRASKNLFTHDEYVRMITEKGYDGNDFKVVDVNTKEGMQKRWKLEKQASGA